MARTFGCLLTAHIDNTSCVEADPIVNVVRSGNACCKKPGLATPVVDVNYKQFGVVRDWTHTIQHVGHEFTNERVFQGPVPRDKPVARGDEFCSKEGRNRITTASDEETRPAA
jgi:hypothetical protein